MDNSSNTEPAPRWAIVEIMGHRIVAGRLTYGTPPYTAGVEVEIPLPDGSYLPEYYSAGAIFALRIVPEEVARGQGLPFHVREITRALLPAPAKTTPVRPQEREALYAEIDGRLTDQEYDEVAYPDRPEACEERIEVLYDRVTEGRREHVGRDTYRRRLRNLAAEVIAAIESHDRVDAEFDLDGYTPDEDDGEDDDEDDEGDLLSDPESGGPADESHGGGCP